MSTDTPNLDPTPIFELFRGVHATELLTAAVSHFDLFRRLAAAPLALDTLRSQIGLAERPANVLLTALRAMGVVERDAEGRLLLSNLGREFLLPQSQYYIGDYIDLFAGSPGVLEIVERLKTNRPAGEKPAEEGAAFIYREGLESAMEKEATARKFTLALAGRAKCVAPYLADLPLMRRARRLLDVGGGTGLYSLACLQRSVELQAIVWDRPEVLKVAAEMAAQRGLSERLELRPGDMFADPVPQGCDVILLSNILHDWDVPECKKLVARCAAALPSGGYLAIHDAFLDDDLGGPLPIALYSTALFSFTEGRAYSAAEYRSWLAEAGLEAERIEPTLVHCGLLPGRKP